LHDGCRVNSTPALGDLHYEYWPEKSPTVARDKMVFSMIETTGSIWMATLDRR
jgi:hypothetical protein